MIAHLRRSRKGGVDGKLYFKSNLRPVIRKAGAQIRKSPAYLIASGLLYYKSHASAQTHLLSFLNSLFMRKMAVAATKNCAAGIISRIPPVLR